MRGLLLVGVLCSAVLLTAPSSGQDKTPAKADIRGVIQKVNPVKKGGEVLASILVDNPKKDTSYDKASVTITKKTKLLRVGAADDRAPTVADLKVGAIVEVIFDGPVAESYPVQGRAGMVRILVKEDK